ncbi:hypothetical protein D3C79_754130 [compost metagenome]
MSRLCCRDQASDSGIFASSLAAMIHGSYNDQTPAGYPKRRWRAKLACGVFASPWMSGMISSACFTHLCLRGAEIAHPSPLQPEIQYNKHAEPQAPAGALLARLPRRLPAAGEFLHGQFHRGHGCAGHRQPVAKPAVCQHTAVTGRRTGDQRPGAGDLCHRP